MATQTYTGSCHCGDVKFEVDLDLSEGGGKCNCSICRKIRTWAMSVKPEAFRLLTDESALTDYQLTPGGPNHQPFCRRCGVHAFVRGDVPEIGGKFVSVQLACLDDADDEALAAAPVRYANGRDNDWWHEPSDAQKKFL